jgi:hypothetical protein
MSAVAARPASLHWRRILGYAFVLLCVQGIVGVGSGFLEPRGSAHETGLAATWAGGSALLTLVICAMVFAHLAFRQAHRPFLHAGLVLAIAMATATLAGLLLATVIATAAFDYGNPHVVLDLLGYAVPASACIAGTTLGRLIRSKGAPSHD